MTPDLVGLRYRLIEREGSFGAGLVWRARDERSGTEVLLEGVPRPYDDEAGERFSDEVKELVRATAALRTHPGLVPVLEVVDDGLEGLWLVMPLVGGRPLDGPLPAPAVLAVAESALSGLAALHAAGVVHGRIQPSTILLDSNAQARLADILEGSVERLREHYRDDDSSTVIVTNRTSDYLAPEVVAGGAPGPASDLFGLGVVLYEALEGHHPFRRGDVYATMYAIQHDVPSPPRSSGDLDALISMLLEKDPDRRPTAEAAREVLIDSQRVPMPEAPPSLEAPPMPLARAEPPVWRTVDDRASELPTTTVPVTIYLSDSAGHERVEAAVEALLRQADIGIQERDDPIVGSWFRRLIGRLRTTANTPAGQYVTDTAMHAAETRLVHTQDAEVTAKLMQNLGPVIDSLQAYECAVVRAGALLIVRDEGNVSVHQLTPVQQLELDRNPKLARSPKEILAALGSPVGDSEPPAPLDGQRRS